MKRAEKKTTKLEKSVTKAKNPVAAKVSAPKNAGAVKQKPIAAAEKTAKKLKVGSSVKVSKEKELNSKLVKKDAAKPPAKKSKAKTSVKSPAPTLKPQKSVSVKNSATQKPAAVKNPSAKIAEKASRKQSTNSLVKLSAPKARKTVSTKADQPGKSSVIKKKLAPAEVKTAKKLKPVVAVSTPKVKKPAAVNNGPKLKKEKAVQTVSVKRSKPEKEQILPKLAANKSVKPAEKKARTILPLVEQKQPKKVKTTKTNAAAVITSAANLKLGKKPETAAKKAKMKPEKRTEKKIEIVIPPVMAKPVKKKIKPIGSAVVRGKSGRYDFEVFPLDAELKDGSAIYVISKRITDKSGRGHHKFVCIGQTESLLGEIKKHKKDKCIKQHKANVICLLREESETNRLKIETDLREAHAIACNQK